MFLVEVKKMLNNGYIYIYLETFYNKIYFVFVFANKTGRMKSWGTPMGYAVGYQKRRGERILTSSTFWSYSYSFVYMKIIFLTYQTSSKLIILTVRKIIKSITAEQIDPPFYVTSGVQHHTLQTRSKKTRTWFVVYSITVVPEVFC